MNRWWLRIALLVLAGTVIEVVLVGAGMQPKLLPVAVILAAIAAVGMLAFDLVASAAPAVWPDGAPPEPPVRVLDSRTESLVRMATREREQEGPSHRLHATLVSLVDDRLRDRHGVDRATDPAAAHRMLGPELTRLVETPPPGAQLAEPARLAGVVALIESI
jgi:hypothetical protein